MIGIIAIQLSWIKNMVLLRKEQIKHSVQESTKTVGYELAQHKGSATTGANKKGFFTDDYYLDMFKPQTIGQRFDVEEIRKKCFL